MPVVMSQSSRPFLIRKGLVSQYAWWDTPMPLAAPFKPPFHTLEVPDKQKDPQRDLILHEFDQADHGQTTW